jgi:oligopeptide/dipeptide ABC transporter ATP-binding protein
VAVMYLGKVAEIADADELYAHPNHPYTKALLSAIPVPDPTYQKDRVILQGDVPSPLNPPSGCFFHPRCPIAQPKCKIDAPSLREVGNSAESHLASCHFPSDDPLPTNARARPAHVENL